MPASSSEDAAYRASSTLDTPPRPLHDIEPAYPEAAGQRDGTVTLELFIGADGRVHRVQVLDAQPPGLFEASAVEAFGQARFEPGRFMGVPVASRMKLAVDYTPVNRGSAVSGASGAAAFAR